MAVRTPAQLDIPAFWLEPVFHSVYLQAMVNYHEQYGEVDCLSTGFGQFSGFELAAHGECAR